MKNNLLSEKLIYTGKSLTPTHLHLCSYSSTDKVEVTGDSFAAVAGSLSDSRTNWLQVHGLKDTETIREVCNHFGIGFLVLQDILNIKHPTKIEEHDHYTVMIMKIFSSGKTENEFRQQQVCLIHGQGFVISFMEGESGFFGEVVAAIQSNVLKIRERASDYLLSVLLNSVMGNYIAIVTGIDDALEELEEKLLVINNGHDIGARIQTLRRQYMLMKKAVLPLKEQYIKLLRSENEMMHKVNRPFFNDVNDHLQFVLQTIDICRETLSSLVDLYISNNDLRMNDIMKRLTVVSTIFIPLTFLAGVWGMNFKFMPELDWRYGYVAAWAIMLVTGLLVYWFLKRKKWH